MSTLKVGEIKHENFTGTTQLKLDSAGRLLVGTTTEGVGGADNFTIAGSGDSGMTIRSGTSSTGGLYFSDGTSGADEYRGVISYNQASNYMRFYTDASERLRIDSSGNVGIGDTSPDRELVVKNASSNATVKIEASNAHTSQLFFSDTDAEGVAKIAVFHGSGAGQNALNFETGGSSRLLIDSSGRLLVNSTSTSIASKLISTIGTGTGVTWSQCGLAVTHVSGANTKSLIGFGFSGNGGSYPPAAIGSFTNSTSGHENNNLVFFTRSATSDTEATERARITSSGSLLVGRTNQITITGDSTDHNFEQLTSNQYALGIHCDKQWQRGIGIYYNTGNDNADAIRFAIGSSAKFIVLGSGNVQNANNSYGSISDVSLKENIVDANSQWNDIKNIKVRNYNFKESTGQQTHTQIGVIAQELETVSPKLVEVSDKDGMKTVQYSVLYMKSVKALQEAQARIETLETKVAALEAK